jgi:hypothetical protein
LKIRVILQARHWSHRLHVIQQLPGRYAVELRGLDGAKLKPPAIMGPLPSIDFIVERAELLHTGLVALREANAVPAAATVSSENLTGHPVIDRHLE